MSRFGAITAHLVALPAALILGTPVAIAVGDAAGPAIDFHVHDTMFVVAPFPPMVILTSAVIAVALVARRYGCMNRLVSASGLCLIVHVISGVLAWVPGAGVPTAADAVVTSSSPELFLLYVASALAGSSTALLGLVVSLWRSLRTREGVVP
jgi:hypothetical protein